MKIFQNIKLEIKNRIGFIIIDRPKVLNAINEQTLLELRKAFRELRNNEKIRVIIITGTGRSFSAGFDLKSGVGVSNSKLRWTSSLGRLVLLEIKTGVEFDIDPVKYFDGILQGGEVNWKIGEKWKPVIAQINGYALGGGLEISCACDFRFASESAILGFPEVDLGIFPAWGGTQLSTLILGTPKAKHLMYTCEKITSKKAKKIGLVDDVFSNDDLSDKTLKFAKSIAKKDPKILKKVKILTEQIFGEKLIKGLALEQKLHLY
ncbi:MAG: enoyl-CoA hydratase/isomerase family protein [Candidatus Helarchaeota archaeon]